MTNFTYNAAGQVTTITDPLSNVTTLTYDHGDLAAVTDPLSRATTFYTDAIGRRVRATDPLGNQAQWVHDPIDGVHQTIDPLGATTTIAYDADGNVASVTDARASVTSYTYDAQGRLTIRTDPLGHTDTVTKYDGDGNALTAADRKGQVVTRTYDPLNRLSTATYADGSTTAYTWDAGNRLTKIQDSIGGTITRVYDGLNRLTSETTPQGTVSYTYDAASRRATMTVPGQAQINYTFDNANRLTLIAQGTTSTTIGYDNASRRTSLTLPNGVLATYALDNASQLTGITYTSGATTVGTLTYGYDLAGRITSRGGTLFQSVLPAAVSSATYDAANRMTARTAAGVTISPTWDLNGSLTNDGLRNYTWDARNRLTTITGLASFVYDGTNRRQTKTISGTATSYLYDGFDVVQEQQAGTASANLLTGLGVDERFSRTAAGATSTYLTDALGSTVALASSTGSVQTSYGYDPYGVTSTSGAANMSSYQFTGREADTTGLYYNRTRYYNPTWARFISEDPIGFRGGTNRYTYTANDPVTLKDPSGLLATMSLGGLVQRTPPTAPTPSPAAYVPGGTQSVPAPPIDPLDPAGLNKTPPSLNEQIDIANTMNLIANGNTGSLNGHPYVNYPSANTGAVLPPDTAGYTSYDVLGSNFAGGGRGTDRIVVGNSTGDAYYTNTHYDSFFPIVTK